MCFIFQELISLVSDFFLLVVAFVVGLVVLFLSEGLTVVGPGRAGTFSVNQAGLELSA